MSNHLADQVWACNSALPYLMDHGVRVTHGVGIDQGEGMLADWDRVFDVTYMIASSVHPKLVQHLRTNNRRLRWFHNYLGIPDPDGWVAENVCIVCRHVKEGVHEHHEFTPMSHEMWLYQNLYASSCIPAFGLNVVSRAIGVALWMGFDRILVYGADCAAAPDGPQMPAMDDPAYPDWAKQIVVYADGRTAFDVYGPNGNIVQAPSEHFGGRRWHTRADMMITAQHLVIMAEQNPHIRLMGDTLPKAIMHMTPEQRAAIPTLDGKGNIVGFKCLTGQEAAVSMTLPEAAPHLFQAIRSNAKYAKRMIGAAPNTHKGQTVAICGAGPSLRALVEAPQLVGVA